MLGWSPLFQSWLATLPAHLQDQHALITQLYNRIVPPCIDFVRKAGFKVKIMGQLCTLWAQYVLWLASQRWRKQFYIGQANQSSMHNF